MFKKFFEFFTPAQEELLDQDVSLNKSHPFFVINKIHLVYDNTQRLLQKESKKLSQKTDLQWHAQFVEHQKRTFAEVDKVDLCLKIDNNIYEKAVKQWLQYIYKITSDETESLAQFSQRIAWKNQDYATKFDEFKKLTVQDGQSIREALIRIKLIIESTQWEAENWNSNKKIIIGNKEKEIPDYAFQIYELCTNKSNQPTQLLEEIHSILQNIEEKSIILFDSGRESSENSSEENFPFGL